VSISFDEAIRQLDIEEYRDRIWHSNSRGELMHLQDYCIFASIFKDETKFFKSVFEYCVRFAEEKWSRPESCFQHMPRLIGELLDSGIEKGYLK
jgi:hypothetical protein